MAAETSWCASAGAPEGWRGGAPWGPAAYAELVRHGLVDQPVSCYDHIRLGGLRLGQLEEEARGLGEALRRVKDGVEEVDGKRAKSAAAVKLGGGCQRVCHMRHGVYGGRAGSCQAWTCRCRQGCLRLKCGTRIFVESLPLHD